MNHDIIIVIIIIVVVITDSGSSCSSPLINVGYVIMVGYCPLAWLLTWAVSSRLQVFIMFLQWWQ